MIMGNKKELSPEQREELIRKPGSDARLSVGKEWRFFPCRISASHPTASQNEYPSNSLSCTIP